MRIFLDKYWRIILSIVLSFLFAFFVAPFFMTPGKIGRVIVDTQKYFQSINLKKLFTNQTDNEIKKTNEQSRNDAFNFDKIEPTEPEPTMTGQITPTVNPTEFPTPTFSIPASPTLTSAPTPTKTPKPTRPPDVFPIDPALARPGKTTDEVFNLASQKTCVPVAVLKGIAYIESGSFFDVVPPKYFLLYNSSNWWNSQFLTEERRACGGYDYDNGSGIIPDDSKYAGWNCHSDGSTGATSYIMGPMQVNGLEQSKFGSNVASAFGIKNIDRRIILDAIAIVGFISKQNVQPSSCTNWSGWQVAKAACGYYGTCGFGDGTYYCNTFCRNYKNFGGKADCQAAVNKMQDNCWQ